MALVVAGFIGGVGQIFLTSCYRYADVSTIAPFEYVSLAISLTIGWFVFSDVPTVQMLIGAAIVVAAGLFIIWREHQARFGAKTGKSRAKPLKLGVSSALQLSFILAQSLTLGHKIGTEYPMQNSHDELSGLIGQIYDCAVQPELWPQTLNTIKQSLDLAFLQVVSVDGYRLRQGQAVQTLAFKTLFEQGWINDFARHFNKIPGGQIGSKQKSTRRFRKCSWSRKTNSANPNSTRIGLDRGVFAIAARCRWSNGTI